MVVLKTDAEKQELDVVVDRLTRSPRLAKLLRFLGDRHLRGDASPATEFEIATGVFERAPDFNQTTDAIARVEIHRLRKKLTVYYQTEGRNNAVRISVPSGSYRTVFTHRMEDAEVVAVGDGLPDAEKTKVVDVSTPPVSIPARPRKLWMWLAAFLAAAGIVTFLAWKYSDKLNKAVPVTPSSSSVSAPLPAAGSGDGAVRLLAGYAGQPHIDPMGRTWSADKFFDRGGGWHGKQTFTARTNDEFLYQTYRTGEFDYHIPLKPGSYELHLFFDETGFGPGLGGGEGTRLFTILMNGQPLVSSFDIVSDAMGPNVADERIFRDVSPAADGKLHLIFEGVSGKPIINALEIVPGQPHRQLPIRITTQPTPFLDQAGNVWSPDNYFLGGQSSLPKPHVTGTADPGLFSMERWGHFSYALPVDPRGTYSVTLYFAEFYFGPDSEGKGGPGSRRFNVFCNGQTLLNDFDIFKEAGALHAFTRTFHHLKPSPQGKLNLTFEPITNYANVSAIEVLDEGR